MDLDVGDRFAIQDLLAKYGVLMDRQDEAWVDLFTEDAELRVAGEAPVLKADLERFFLNSKRGLHLASPPVILSAGDGTARVTQTFLFRNALTELFRTGYYEDDLVRRDGSWRFQVRRVEFFDT
jgi:SnoaL-like domain